MEQLILKTLDVNAILHDVKALKTLVSYAQGSPIYVGSLIKEMVYNGIRRLSETYLKENAQKGMNGYVIMILQRLLKAGNDYRTGGLHTLSCLMFLANHVEERKCHEQLLRAFADEIDAPMEEKFNDIYDRRTFNRSIDYLSGQINWIKNYGVPIKSDIKIYNGKIFLIDQDNKIFALDTNDGAQMWDVLSISSFIKSQNLLSLSLSKSGDLFAITSSADVFKIETSTGNIIWSRNTAESLLKDATDFFTSSQIVYINDQIIFSSGKSLLKRHVAIP